MTTDPTSSKSLADMSVGDLIEAAEQASAAGGALAAAELYEAWLGRHGGQPLAFTAYFNLGVCYTQAGAPLKAARAFRDGLRINPGFGPLAINLGAALEGVGDPQGAIEAWRQGLSRLSALSGEAVSEKGVLLTQTARLLQHHMHFALAEPLLLDAIDLEPHFEEAVREWLTLRARRCSWPVVQATKRVSAERQRSTIWPLALAAQSDDPLFQLARAWRHQHTEFQRPTRADLEAVAAARAPRNARARLKIGYVSSDLREHAVGHGMTEVFELHDRSRFEVFAYYIGIPGEDAIKARIRNAVEHWVDLTAASDKAAATRIASDGVDILVDLNGYTKFARTPIFALRPAPVQVNWFGYPATMGTPYHHYLIADATIIPPGSEIYYSEEVLRLPCYQPNDRRRDLAPEPRRSDYGLPDAAFVYCSFNATQKLTRRTFDLWLTILKNAPGSVLWMLDGGDDTGARLAAYAESKGVAADRLIRAKHLPNALHLARYPLADLFLDSFPWGAHTTASDALAMGVPVLTLTGRGFAARVCTSLVKAAGLPELACASEAEYVGKALTIAQQPATAADLRRRLAETKDRCLLFDVDRLVRALEGLYAEMARREAQGRTPRPQLANLEAYHEIGTKLDFDAVNKLADDEYLRTYRDALAECDLHMPLADDGRLWKGSRPAVSKRRAAAGG